MCRALFVILFSLPWSVFPEDSAIAAEEDRYTLSDIRIYRLLDESIPDPVSRVSLSHDGSFAALEVHGKNSRDIVLFNMKNRMRKPVDPRVVHEGYRRWKESIYSRIYRTEDFDVQWNPSPQYSHWLAFVGNGIDNNLGIYLYDTRMNRYYLLTQPDGNAMAPRWSPDGLKLMYLHKAGEVSMLRIVNDMERILRHSRVGTSDAPPPELRDVSSDRQTASARVDISQGAHLAGPVWCSDTLVLVAYRDSPGTSIYTVRLYSQSLNTVTAGSISTDSIVSLHPVRDQDAVLVATTGPGGAALFKHNFDWSAKNAMGAKSDFIRMVDRAHDIVPPARVSAMQFLVADTREGKNNLYIIDAAKPDDLALQLDFPEEYQSAYRSYSSVSTCSLGRGDTTRLLLCYTLGSAHYLCAASLVLHRARSSSRGYRVRYFSIGASAGLSLYAGTAGRGDYRPAVTLRAEVTPAPESKFYWTLGVQAGYSELSKSVSIDKPFVRSYAYGEAISRIGYRLQRVAPYVFICAGKGWINQYYTGGARQKPNSIGAGFGTDLSLSAATSLSLEVIYRMLNIEIRRGSADDTVSNAFVSITAGLHFLF